MTLYADLLIERYSNIYRPLNAACKCFCNHNKCAVAYGISPYQYGVVWTVAASSVGDAGLMKGKVVCLVQLFIAAVVLPTAQTHPPPQNPIKARCVGRLCPA